MVNCHCRGLLGYACTEAKSLDIRLEPNCLYGCTMLDKRFVWITGSIPLKTLPTHHKVNGISFHGAFSVSYLMSNISPILNQFMSKSRQVRQLFAQMQFTSLPRED